MTPVAEDVINWSAFTETRSALGDAFVRILGYFREDGTKSVRIGRGNRSGGAALCRIAARPERIAGKNRSASSIV
jgi:hypothetical protein